MSLGTAESGLIEFVAQNLPLVPDSLRGPLQSALSAMADYGLTAIGLPPTLPNFDDLAGMGTDYLATVAMEQAGIPANDIMKDGMEDLAGAIADGMTSSADSPTPNPMNWNFIKHDPDYLYRPAYLMIELYNDSDKPSPGGRLIGSVTRVLNSQTELYDNAKMHMYAKFGGNTYYDLFKPVAGQVIPALAPGQRLTIPVFLEEYMGIPYYNNGPVVDPNDFGTLYWNFGEFQFEFSILYDCPPVEEEAKAQGYTKTDAIYSYSTTAESIGFSKKPYESYTYTAN
jgi:hypothetical protein